LRLNDLQQAPRPTGGPLRLPSPRPQSLSSGWPGGRLRRPPGEDAESTQSTHTHPHLRIYPTQDLGRPILGLGGGFVHLAQDVPVG